MGSTDGPVPGSETKPHAVLIPYPAQGHVNPMLKLAKLLHHSGFYITFVNTDFNHRRLLRSGSLSELHRLPEFRFDSIPDGLPPSDADATQDIPSLCTSTTTTCLEPFCDLLSRLNAGDGGAPPVSCIVSDGVMSFTLKAAERFRLPEVLFWTTSACGLLGYTQYRRLVEKGYTPLKDMSQASNGYMETTIDWVAGMSNDIRLRDFPSFIRTTDPNDIMLNFLMQEADAIPRGKALIMNTFDELERDALEALSAIVPRIYTFGPLQLMMSHVHDERLDIINSSLWKEDSGCIEWLDTKDPGSVFYVNFGSITVVTAEQLTEFAWGLANSKKPFLWIIRPDIVVGESAMLPPEFLAETKDRSLMISWCPQEKVLQHPAIGGFLTHNGWNSTIESIASGVPVICWPFFAEQQTNCRYCCVEWGIGMEIDNNVKRDEVELLVRKLMDGDEGKKMKANAMTWKRKAEEATAPGGSSYSNFNKIIHEVLLE
ncbi:7-deoxyloganetin glucosyltransferase-like [Andrographis paniculata]|uniref:7-deoxyloganetin glucosyltransferase-like n=1 Tax=Andrographis paniculata TaxID=175694 RepID=UPI0021E8D63E|nr:7-deoxyloganetin glucosyltransferase-like [Andrographis paniculata]